MAAAGAAAAAAAAAGAADARLQDTVSTPSRRYTYTRTQDGRHYICPHCSAIKTNQNTMHYHLKTHETAATTAAVAADAFECGTCKRRFFTGDSLDLHIRVRHPEVLFCPFVGCNYKTKVKSSLTIHYLRSHCSAEVLALAMATGSAESAPPLTSLPAPPIECRACGKLCKSNAAFHYHVLATGCLPCPPPLKPLMASRMSETSQSSDTDESQTPQMP